MDNKSLHWIFTPLRAVKLVSSNVKPTLERSISQNTRLPFLMCKHRRLAAIEPHGRMLRESRSIVLVNRSRLPHVCDRLTKTI